MELKERQDVAILSDLNVSGPDQVVSSKKSAEELATSKLIDANIVTDSEMIQVVGDFERQQAGAVEDLSDKPVDNVTISKVANEASKNSETDSDVSLVFGPGASKLATAENLVEGLNTNLEDSSSNSSFLGPKKETSTPLREVSLGRRRTRNSGRSSFNSPSPVRPPQIHGKKAKLDPDMDDPGEENVSESAVNTIGVQGEIKVISQLTGNDVEEMSSSAVLSSNQGIQGKDAIDQERPPGSLGESVSNVPLGGSD